MYSKQSEPRALAPERAAKIDNFVEQHLNGQPAVFIEDGTFTDESIGVTWQGPRELPEQVENYHRAFPDMHREMYHVYIGGDMVVVQRRAFAPHVAII